MHIKLPAFKVTQRTRGGVLHHCSIPRGRTVTKPPDTNEDRHSDVKEEDSAVQTDSEVIQLDSVDAFCEGKNTQPNVSLHAIKQRAATEAWEHVRSTMLKAVVESNAMPADQCCINCSNCATIRCAQCAPWAFYCQKCFAAAHSRINIFHTGQVWEVLKTLINLIISVYRELLSSLINRMECTNAFLQIK